MRCDQLLALGILSVTLSALQVSAGDNPIASKLEGARTRYQKALDEVDQKVFQHFDRREQSARKAGNLALIATLQESRERYREKGIFPDDAPAICFRQFSLAHGDYLVACEQAIKSYTQAGKETEAQETQKLLAELQETGLTRSTRFQGVAHITAKKEVGYDIGKIYKKDRIRLSYVGGKWKGWGNVASDSPDEAELEQGDRNRLVLCEADRQGRTRVLAIIPPGSRHTPFELVADRNYERVVLRINDNDNDFDSNPDDDVRYQLHVQRGN